MLANARPKPAKGSALMERRMKRQAIKAYEEAEKRKVRLRDKTCRWPDCEYCRKFQPRLEVAHLEDKGMGGDHGNRTSVELMMLFCFLIHQGPVSIHSGDRRVEFMTERKANGPCRFWEQSEGGWRVVHVEDGR